MKIRKRAILSIIMSASLLLSACGGEKSKKQAAENIDTSSYPIKTDATLTYWTELNINLTASCNSMAETPFAKKLKENTGINVEYIHPSTSGVSEQFSIMLASEELPDIIESRWYSFSGGPQTAIDDGYIIPLNDYMDKYAPNYRAYLDKNKELDDMVKTGSGQYYCFPFVRGDDLLKTASGAFIRQDWLDELGLEKPQTIDDWENMLRAFKEKKGATAPFSCLDAILSSTSIFAGAYGVCDTFYVENDKIHYGPIENGYKEFLTTMNRWYKEKLIDNNFASIDNKTFESNMLNGKSGAAVGLAGSHFGKFADAGKKLDENYKLVGVSNPTLKKGKLAKFGQREWMYSITGSSAAISTSCVNIELAMRLLDYAYSEEGNMLYNFGIEGESYEMIDGYPTYTDLIMNNPDGLSVANAMSLYARACNSGPFVQRREYIEQYYTLPEQKDAISQWTKTDNAKYALPVLSYTAEESEELAGIITDVNTYFTESRMQFIMGVKSLDEFDIYVDAIKNLNIDRAIKIYQAAYDRYKSQS